MKSRSGAKEDERTFGPQQPPTTVWQLVRRCPTGFQTAEAVAPTAFQAVQSLGWALGELVADPVMVPPATPSKG
jgi:hypothetical protein